MSDPEPPEPEPDPRFEIGMVYATGARGPSSGRRLVAGAGSLGPMRLYVAMGSNLLVGWRKGVIEVVVPRKHERYRPQSGLTVEELCSLWEIEFAELDRATALYLDKQRFQKQPSKGRTLLRGAKCLKETKDELCDFFLAVRRAGF